MTDRNTLIETLTNVIRAHRNVGLSSEIEAAAVLELVGPKPLVWIGKESDCFINCDMGHRDYDLCVSDTLERTCDYVWSASYQESGMGRPIHLGSGTLEAAKAVAQAHADATHWSNTKIGDAE